jgi:FkbH-like protein
LNLPGSIAFAPYGQIFQELLNPSSVLSTNRRGVNVLLIRLEDWQADLEKTVDEFCAALAGAVRDSSVPWLTMFCPAPCQATSDSERGRFLTRMEEHVCSTLAAIPGTRVITSAELAHAYPVETIHDPHADQAAHVPYTRDFFTALATMTARQIYNLAGPAYKAVVVDCDNTLWTGACSEDGSAGVGIDAARQSIQDYFVGLHDKGVLVCLCSRNDAADVHAVFDSRAEMRLGLRHIVSQRLNWEPKSHNLVSIATELGLSPDAFVFLDDDPVECAEVQANCPRALVIQLPRPAQAIAPFLRNLWLFDGWRATDEAKQRTDFYKQNAARERALQKAPSMTDFLANLDLKVQFAPLTPAHVARAAELTHRTNRFNSSAIKRSEADLASVQRDCECLVVRVKDRFGDYGLVGLIVFTVVDSALAIDTFLLSCRALGRGVEHQMLARVGQIAGERGLSRLDMRFVANGKNVAIVEFLQEVADVGRDHHATHTTFRIPAQQAARVRHQPAERRPDVNSEIRVPESMPETILTDSRARSALLVAIARDLSDAAEVSEQISARRSARPDTANEYVEPRTPAERTIVAILADVLGLDRVGVEDNFFQIGGHSLLAMQVLFRIREAFQVELSARLLYQSTFTAADLASKVLEAQLAAADPELVASLIHQVNELSDEEVAALLEEKNGRLSR